MNEDLVKLVSNIFEDFEKGITKVVEKEITEEQPAYFETDYGIWKMFRKNKEKYLGGFYELPKLQKGK
ncbi:MAG: hypothetical protein AABW56_00175 [Nanoarchaeota archaeon]